MSKKRNEMKKIIGICIILIFILDGCNSKKEKSMEEKLRGLNYKYWLTYKNFPSSGVDSILSTEEGIFINYFDKNGKFLLFYKANLLSEVEKDMDNPIPDIVNSNTWCLQKDSILTINDVNFQIKKLEDDMLIIYSPYSKNYVLYIAAPDSLIPMKYHCIQ